MKKQAGVIYSLHLCVLYACSKQRGGEKFESALGEYNSQERKNQKKKTRYTINIWIFIIFLKKHWYFLVKQTMERFHISTLFHITK